MAQMERNVNLEEIDSDALFGIDALKGQSILQKIIFFTCLGVGIVANVCMPMFLGTPRAVCIFIFWAYPYRHCFWMQLHPGHDIWKVHVLLLF